MPQAANRSLTDGKIVGIFVAALALFIILFIITSVIYRYICVCIFRFLQHCSYAIFLYCNKVNVLKQQEITHVYIHVALENHDDTVN